MRGLGVAVPEGPLGVLPLGVVGVLGGLVAWWLAAVRSFSRRVFWMAVERSARNAASNPLGWPRDRQVRLMSSRYPGALARVGTRWLRGSGIKV